MRSFRSILVIVPVNSPRRQVQHLVQNTMVLGRWLKCEIHFFSNPSETVPLDNAISKFRNTHSDSPSTLTICPPTDAPGAGILGALQKYSCDLILIQDSVILNQTKGIDERRLLEQSPVPVFLIPREADFTAHAPHAFLAPLSGEKRRNEAVAAALALAAQTHSPIDLLHVTTPSESCTCGQAMEGLGDQYHYEYQQMVEKVASEVSPFSTPEERSRIRHFYHCKGFTTEEITNILNTSPGTILVLEWKGTFGRGKAETIKKILKLGRHTILFVREFQEEKSILRVGRHLRAS